MSNIKFTQNPFVLDLSDNVNICGLVGRKNG